MLLFMFYLFEISRTHYTEFICVRVTSFLLIVDMFQLSRVHCTCFVIHTGYVPVKRCSLYYQQVSVLITLLSFVHSCTSLSVRSSNSHDQVDCVLFVYSFKVKVPCC